MLLENFRCKLSNGVGLLTWHSNYELSGWIDYHKRDRVDRKITGECSLWRVISLHLRILEQWNLQLNMKIYEGYELTLLKTRRLHMIKQVHIICNKSSIL